jgi:ABC-type antimicrobial peptide transport system permease subunit
LLVFAAKRGQLERWHLRGRPARSRAHDDIQASWDRVTPGYFETIGNRIVRGRPITEQDTAASQHVAVVSEGFARKFFKTEDPIGKHFGHSDIRTAREFEIVGVAQDARYMTYNLDQPPAPMFFAPGSQYTLFPKADDRVGEVRTHYLHEIVVLMNPGIALSDTGVRRAMAAVDPNLPVTLIRSLSEQVAATFSQQRLIARLTSLFGFLSLVLASIGIYGVTAYNAGSRTNEIGALGANRGHVVRLVLWGMFPLIGGGLLLGLPLTFAAGRFLGSQLYGMNPYDPTVTLASALALGASALVASLIPALRASFVSPSDALRAE